MRTALKSRRGATLAEVMVSLALVATMITMTVSFTVLITERTKVNAANDALRQDCQKIEAGAEGWLNAILAKDGAALQAPDPSTSNEVTVKINEALYTLKFSYNSLIGTLPDGRQITVHTERVQSVTFEVMENADESDQLLFCHVLCADQGTPYTFCINPRVGERGGA